MNEITRTSVIKLDKWETFTIRKRMEHFNNREEGDEELVEVELFPLNHTARFSLISVPIDEDEMNCLVEPWLRISEEINAFHCKIWVENLAGEKCPEVEFGKQDSDDRDDGDLCYYKDFDFGRFDRHQFFTDDVAIVFFEMSYYVSDADYNPPVVDLDFRRNLWQTCKAGLNDLTLKVGEKEIKVSKAVLASQSAVFNSMLLLNSIEAQTGVVEMEDETYETVQAFVEFVYMGSTEKLTDLAEGLYILAEKYDVPKLKYQCVKQLNDGISDENVFERLVMAFVYSDAELKKAVLAHIMDKSNQINCATLLTSQDWTDLLAKNSKVANEICNAILSKCGY